LFDESRSQTYEKKPMDDRPVFCLIFAEIHYSMKKIAIVAGGDSGEFQISMLSGNQVFTQIDRDLYEPYLIRIRGDQWVCLLDDQEISVNKNDFSIDLDDGHHTFDAVFNAIHGTPGEDGKLQGYFDMLKIPYTSSNLSTSSLTFHKAFCKDVVGSFGIETPIYQHLTIRQRDGAMEVLKDFATPCFVKPNGGGSSVGMSKVMHFEELPDAIDLAFSEDDEIIVEEFVEGRELTCAVLRSEGHLIALPVCEIVTKKDFFDYEAKYTPGITDEIVPAPVDEAVALECQRLSTLIYERLNCSGIIRVDYILHEKGLSFLEVNTVPGLTRESIVPKMIEAHGWSYTDLVTRLLKELFRKT
jgi:D-alanine-D-alanine ligase